MTFFFSNQSWWLNMYTARVSQKTHQRDSAQQKRLCLIVQSLDAAGYFYCCVSGQTLEKRIKHFFFGRQQKKRKAKDSFRHVRPSTDLGEFRVRFVDGVRCCVNSVSELLLQKPVGLCCLAYPAIENSGEMCIRKWYTFQIPEGRESCRSVAGLQRHSTLWCKN